MPEGIKLLHDLVSSQNPASELELAVKMEVSLITAFLHRS